MLFYDLWHEAQACSVFPWADVVVGSSDSLAGFLRVWQERTFALRSAFADPSVWIMAAFSFSEHVCTVLVIVAFGPAEAELPL